MTLTKSLSLSRAVLLAVTVLTGVAGAASAVGSTLPDYSGIWRLDDLHSDSPSTIEARLRIERKREQPAQQPTYQAASSTASARPSYGGHAGGRGMGGGGMGRGSMGGHHGHGQQSTSKADNGTPPPDAPPPLLADDSLLNVQQGAGNIREVLDDADHLDTRLDGVARQSLDGSAMVRSHLTPAGLEIIMQFDGDVRLRQDWAKSPDGRHLTVTETWTTPAVQQPIVFRRRYDRLDI